MKKAELKQVIEDLLLAAEAERKSDLLSKQDKSSYYQWGRASALREVLDLL